MSVRKQELQAALESYYRDCGWKAERLDDGTIRATGIGGVTWIGLPVTRDDLDHDEFETRLLALSDERMPAGELCPLELLPDEDCDQDLRLLLGRLGLAQRTHVQVYSLAA